MQMSELEQVKQNMNKLIDDSFAKLKVEMLTELRKELQELLNLKTVEGSIAQTKKVTSPPTFPST